jgi:hypothetical protein
MHVGKCDESEIHDRFNERCALKYSRGQAARAGGAVPQPQGIPGASGVRTLAQAVVTVSVAVSYT